MNEESEIEIDIEENNTSDVINIESVIDENESDDDDAENEAEEEKEVNNQETDTQIDKYVSSIIINSLLF